MRTRTAPTHILTIEVPLSLDADAERDFDPLQDYLRLVLPVTRIATANVLCDDPQVSLREVEE